MATTLVMARVAILLITAYIRSNQTQFALGLLLRKHCASAYGAGAYDRAPQKLVNHSIEADIQHQTQMERHFARHAPALPWYMALPA